MPDLSPEALDTLRGDIRRAVAAGFEPPDRIAADAADGAADDAVPDGGDLLPLAERLTAEALAVHLYEQAGWPDVTDCDRLDAAFAALEADGIVARQHFSCCGNCGHAEMGDEIAQAEDAGRAVRGYTFYHLQNTESAVEGHGLYLSYGATEPGDAAAEAVAGEVVAALAAHGLRPRWTGSVAQCVFVPLDWKRRRPAVIMAG
jgi:hypothetical protein